ncbi:MAG: tetratricopeptide repeat protein [Desulfuromonadaceae bacterium]|nr:tetratricopeptide repeat protein [Desulfuromonadaceae bacterium]
MEQIRENSISFISLAMKAPLCCLFWILVSAPLCIPDDALASIPNRVYRVDIRPKKEYTRITLRLAEPPAYNLAAIPGNRLRLVIEDTDGTIFKKFRRYSDQNIGGLLFSKRGERLIVTFQISPRVGWRDLSRPDISAITLDVGTPFKPPAPHPSLAGREKIWSGLEKLVRDFDPPLKSEIPFSPTDRQVLANLLDENDQKSFMAAESDLYKGRLSDAEEAFTQFASRQAPVRPLALYRLAETWYKLQKYPQALAAFREAEKLWPAYLGFNPSVTFYYGDSIARSGELAPARSLLAGLIARLADKKFAPVLLVRLGDILSRQGHEHEAMAIYENVSENFKDNKANPMAFMRLADAKFLQATPWNYRSLSDVYLNASRQAGDLDMREESIFKHVLLESINSDAGTALRLVIGFQRKFPRGVYAAVIRTMREVLVAEVYRQTPWENDPASLVRFVEEHHEYLSGCMEQPGFLKKVTRAYRESGLPIELVKFLNSLVDKQWSASVAPEMYVEIADNAELIGDIATAERAFKGFLRKYPANPTARLMMERLGALYFASDKHKQVKETMLWLLNKGEKAQRTGSYYILGRSLWSLQDHSQAGKAMALFLASPGGRDPRLLPDAYFVAASASEASGDLKVALKLLDTALKLPDNRRNEEFLYKIGEINLRDGNIRQATVMFESLAKNSKDPDWKKLAQQALASIGSKTPVR